MSLIPDGTPAAWLKVTLWIVVPKVHVTSPPVPMSTLFGVKKSPDVVETPAILGNRPVTVTATLAVRVTEPIVNDTAIFVVPA